MNHHFLGCADSATRAADRKRLELRYPVAEHLRRKIQLGLAKGKKPVGVSLPYLASNKNVAELFNKIGSAAVPPKFTQEFLATTIGLKGTNDRSLIPLLRNLGFLDQSNTPTSTYSLLKSKERRGGAIAHGIETAYKPLFAADEEAFELAGEKLKGLIAQVAGTDD